MVIRATENDIVNLTFYLRDKDPITGSISPHNLSCALTISFYLRAYDANVNTIETKCEVVNANLGICRTRVTIPAHGDYYGEVEVIEPETKITWTDFYLEVREELK